MNPTFPSSPQKRPGCFFLLPPFFLFQKTVHLLKSLFLPLGVSPLLGSGSLSSTLTGSFPFMVLIFLFPLVSLMGLVFISLALSLSRRNWQTASLLSACFWFAVFLSCVCLGKCWPHSFFFQLRFSPLFLVFFPSLRLPVHFASPFPFF